MSSWATDNEAIVTEPSTEKKGIGFIQDEKPNVGHMNWLFNTALSNNSPGNIIHLINLYFDYYEAKIQDLEQRIYALENP